MGKSATIKTLEGVVLAGGLNTRFRGEIKAKFIIDEKPIIGKTLALLEEFFKRVSIVANDQEAFSEYSSYQIVKDIFQKVGPLGGIHSALANADAESDAVFVFACDMPSLDKKLIRDMLEKFGNSDCEVLIPSRGGYNEPLHAIYSISVLERLEAFLSTTKNFAIKDFLGLTRLEIFPVTEEDAFTNINTPDDLEKYRSSNI